MLSTRDVGASTTGTREPLHENSEAVMCNDRTAKRTDACSANHRHFAAWESDNGCGRCVRATWRGRRDRRTRDAREVGTTG